MNKKSNFKILLFLTVMVIPLFLSSPAFSVEVKQSTTITYTVKKGDTLWGLSKKFFDSPWYWPGLWAENSEIKNPHWIYPGQEITLYNKNALSNVINNSDEIKTPNDAVAHIIKSSNKESVNLVKEYNKEVQKKNKKPAFVYRKINKLPFITKKLISPDGIITRGVTPLEMYSTTDQIYINAKEGNEKFLIGEKYAIYKQPVKVIDPKNKKNFYGYQYNLAGVIEILKKEGKLLRAVITNTYRPIVNGDLITEFNEISPDIFLRPSVPSLKGKIIKEKENSIFMGEKSIGFIDAGSTDGVKRGQIYSVVEEQKISIPNSKEKIIELIPFGSFVVLETAKTTACVLILEAEKQIPAGALFISPSM